eukprot:gene15107-21163_t
MRRVLSKRSPRTAPCGKPRCGARVAAVACRAYQPSKTPNTQEEAGRHLTPNSPEEAGFVYLDGVVEDEVPEKLEEQEQEAAAVRSNQRAQSHQKLEEQEQEAAAVRSNKTAQSHQKLEEQEQEAAALRRHYKALSHEILEEQQQKDAVLYRKAKARLHQQMLDFHQH